MALKLFAPQPFAQHNFIHISGIVGTPLIPKSCKYRAYHGSFGDSLWFELGFAVLFEAVKIGAVRGHDAVETGSSRLETLFLCLIVTLDQAHELTHTVSLDTDRGSSKTVHL